MEKTMNAIRQHTTPLTKLAAAALIAGGLGLATTAFSASTANADPPCPAGYRPVPGHCVPDYVNPLDVAAYVRSHPGDEAAKAALDAGEPMKHVPPGFSAGSCQPSANPPPSPIAVAALDCVNNTMPGGPPFARTEMFADQDTLNNAFQADAGSTMLQPCPGSRDSVPATWTATNPPPASGSVMCYTSSDNMAHVEWTNIPELVKIDASGPDMASLYGWWHGLVTTS